MMAKGGNNQRSNGSKFTKSYNASNSFVTKVASRVSDYLGGWFGTPLKSTSDEKTGESTPTRASGEPTDKLLFENVDGRRTGLLSHRILDDVEALPSPSKRFKVSEKERIDIEFPISPIPSTSGLFQNARNHTLDVSQSQEYGVSAPGPSNPRPEKFRHDVPSQTTGSTTTEVKANGATDNHSDSSESTSGCSSLVPQSDRLSQSAYVCSNRKRNLEEKLKYARQLQQSRASLYLNRSIPVGNASGGRKKPSFDVTAYGSPALDKSLLREKLINSPFYTGQTSYGGASAYRLSRNTFYSQRSPKPGLERREGVQVQVKPSHHGSTEDLSNMSHTAKKILEALEQFSTPVTDAKRIPVGRSAAATAPLGLKRRRFEELPETRLKLTTPASPLNPNPGPVITGLNVPTVPDLLKLKRLERIQNSTAAARQVAVQKQEYSLPSEKGPKEKRTGKIVTKLKNKEKDVPLEKLEEVNLPKIPLPITTLPKFDFKLPPMTAPTETKPQTEAKAPAPSLKNNFVFSPPIPVLVNEVPEQSVQKNNFTFSNPLNTSGKTNEGEKATAAAPPPPLLNFMSGDAVAKLKRKSISDGSVRLPVPPVSMELKTGSVMDFLSKTDDKAVSAKPASGAWECGSCLIRNVNDSKICRGCRAKRVPEDGSRTSSAPKTSSVVPETKAPPSAAAPAHSPAPAPPPSFGFGDKFKPPSGSWSCKECFVNNDATAVKCVACESPKPSAGPAKEAPKPAELPKPAQNGFGELFKKPANQWECSVCMIRNKETDNKCAACESPKPGAKPEPKLNFGIPPGGGFKFGIDKAGTEDAGVKTAADSSTFQSQKNGTQSEPIPGKPQQFNAISTSVGVFTFGIPAATPVQSKKEEPAVDGNKPATETNSSFLVTSTSGSNLQKEEAPPPEKKCEPEKLPEKKPENETEASKQDAAAKPFIFGAANAFFASGTEGKPPAEGSEPTTFVFGASSNANTLDTVSSSTTDFVFGQKKAPQFNTKANAETNKLAPAPAAFQFKPFVPPETVTSKLPVAEEKKTEAPAPAPASVASPPQPFGSSLFNAPKVSFGAPATSSATLGFGTGSLSTSSGSLFGASAPSFTTSGFNAQTSSAPANTSFGVMSQSTEKPAFSTGLAFGTTSTSFSSVPFGSFGTTSSAPNPEPPKPFGSFGATSSAPNPEPPKPFGSFGATSSAPNPEPPKPFGSFGASSSVPGFGNNPVSAPSFGSGFGVPEKPWAPAPAPFIFGASTTAAPTVTAPGVFAFGAPKPESKPSFSFGQSAAPNFSFGSNAPATNVFGGFGQSKPENSLGGGSAGSLFGNPSGNMFGQSSAPAAFESAAAKFEFGNPGAPRQETAPAVFQFGATPSQPASAPSGGGGASGFSLSVPEKFNFTGGQPTTFTAKPGEETSSSSSSSDKSRKMIKAMRRTNRDPTRRPQ